MIASRIAIARFNRHYSCTAPRNTAFTYTLQPNLRQAQHDVSMDFRSDTVTVPTERMMQSILNASFADAIQTSDASTTALESYISMQTSFPAALFALSGVASNQLSLRGHLTSPPHSVLLHSRAHIYRNETGALPVLSQALVTPVQPRAGTHLTVEDVKEAMIPSDDEHYAPTRVVALENTLRGSVLPFEAARDIRDFVKSYPVPSDSRPIALHLDGARLFEAITATSTPETFQTRLREYCCLFDSVSICLSKGLGAPMGSVILGSKEFIDRVKVFRKMIGGATRQSGMMAAAAHTAVTENAPKLKHVHRLTREAWQLLKDIGFTVSVPVETNMIILDLHSVGVDGGDFKRACGRLGVKVSETGRIVLHHQVGEEGVEKLVGAAKQVWQDRGKTSRLESR